MNKAPLSVCQAEIIQSILIAGPYLYLKDRMGKLNGKTNNINS